MTSTLPGMRTAKQPSARASSCSPVPANQSEILFEAYAGAAATATLVQLPGVGHTDAHLFDRDYSPGRVVQHTTGGITTSGTEPAPTFDALRDFLATHLGS
ncbi:hypothetical protein [Mycolicibacterium hippocampi]|uniref:hypothetical protein n=1 Tax=Mycolicibacterium hippocampi TaxID=659824 RepID=UPI0035126C0F